MKKRVFLDVDGVINDFLGNFLRLIKKTDYIPTHWNFFQDLGYTEKDFWGIIDAEGETFWADCDPYPWKDEVLKLVDNYDKHYDIFFLSSPAQMPQGWSGRKKWLMRHAPKYPMILTNHKYPLAQPGTLLIDDSDKNYKLFTEEGGEAFLFPQPWNASFHSTDRRLSLLEERLRIFSSS